MKVTEGGIVCSGRPGTRRQSCAFPQIGVLPSGRWVCGFRAAPTKASTADQRALVTWSDDQGRTWHDPVEPFIPPMVDGQPGRFRGVALTVLGGARVLATLCWVDGSDPSRPYFNDRTEGLLDTRIFLSESSDDSQTWSVPRRVDTTPFNVPTPITGPVLVLGNGEWACQFELNKPYDDPTVWRHASVLMFSKDEGRTWPEHAVVSQDPDNRIFYWDQRPGVLPDGRILDLFWTFDRRAAVYLNIHARESSDHGRTWSPIWDTGVPGQPAPPVPLPDGRIGMVYVDRSASPVIKMRTSRDGGRTWPADTETVIYRADIGSQTSLKRTMQDVWAEMGRFSVGLPATAVLPGGDVLVVFYAGPRTDLTDVRWTRVSLR